MSHHNNHDHSHSHGHSHGHDHGSCSHHRITPTPQPAPIPLLNYKDNSVASFINIVRFGAKLIIQNMLDETPSLVDSIDPQGFTCMHWAAKRGQVDVMELLLSRGASLETPATDESGMLPIHWSAAEGSIDGLEFFISRGQNINSQDKNGYTSAVVAVQYDQLDALVYLWKRGADLSITDMNGDHCLHWAAYKGHESLVHLSLYIMPGELNRADNYGQSALHLAAIRNNSSIVKDLIVDYHADWMLRDKTGMAALDHAMSKGFARTEWNIRKFTASNQWELLRKLIIDKRYNQKGFAQFFLFGSEMNELGKWAWRGTFVSNGFASIMTLYYAMSEVMSDMTILHFISTVVQVFWWIFFFSCMIKEPGFAESSNPQSTSIDKAKAISYGESLKNSSETINPLNANKEESPYDQVLNAIGRLSDTAYPNHLCHTCRVVKPLRSKHCRVRNKCVIKFDHFCPFVDGSLGRDNYKFFYGLLCTHPFAFILFILSTYIYYRRASIGWMYTFFVLYSCLMMFMMLGLLNYHTRLVARNLSTNEEVNRAKYDYLHDEYGSFNNPFDKGSFSANLMDVIFPSLKLYYTRQEVIRDRNTQ